MRHRKSGRQLGRNSLHRRALYRSLVTSLLEHERIETTEAKAKEVRILADRIISLGKRGDLHARRRALAYVRSKAAVAKLFTDVAGRFAHRTGGYTRLIKTRRRVGDAALMVVLELVARAPEKKAPPPADRPEPGKRALPTRSASGKDSAAATS